MNSSRTYSKKQKLKSRKQIAYLFNDGKSIHLSPVRVLYGITDMQPDEPYCTKAAMSVSSRHFKTAVQRNRIKRVLRECWRLEKSLLENILLAKKRQASLFFIYTGNTMPEYAELKTSMYQIIQRIIKHT